ncbi:hypothetical protein HP567_029105 [Brevibacillus sp. M2.1A]|uniref:hypothetical protein n=1 Tax=Brevibacillus TaxID=55080 RepID=UPI00156BD02F|nr:MULTISPECIES: hypothetical protein [Brevibacillus]MBY0086954.1 hypothetical protein [Brevibacillus brevis]MCC8438596.1 hypothetical protein [Brevibacillus sp. M2.1A]MCE0451584.1 hypothetical protein [Brevibacillus sp. AF8]UKL00623.1 hypothetical protein FO446_25840 [Brevibacillus brevis]
MKKVVVSLLTLAVALSASASAFAAEPAKNMKSSQKAAASVTDPYEPNDSVSFAPYINSNVSYTAAINHNKDVDYFNFYAKPGTFDFAFSRQSTSSESITIWVRKSTGETVHRVVIKGNTSFSVNIPEEGQYYIQLMAPNAMFETNPIAPIPYSFKAIFNQ